MRVGIDPCAGYGEKFQLPHELATCLKKNGRIRLNQIGDDSHSPIWAQGLVDAHQLNLPEEYIFI